MLDCNIFPGLGQDYLAPEVNMFLLPVQENDGDDNLTKAGYKVFIFFIWVKGEVPRHPDNFGVISPADEI